jgi:hypothetical protein
MIYRDPLHQVLGAAEFLKTLKIPTSAPATPALGQVWEASDVLNFRASTGTKFAVDNTTGFGGDVSGTYDAISVDKLKGVSLAIAGATANQVLTFNGTSWVPTTPSATPLGAAGGDLSSTYPNPTVAKIQGVAVSTATPNNGQLMAFDGVQWAPVAPPTSATYDHNSLSGIIGSAAGYHLDANAYDAAMGAAAAGASNVFATMADVSSLASGVNWQDNVQDMSALLAVTAHKDKDVRMVEDNGKAYRFDAQSTAAASATCFVPNDITAPAAGRWLEFINPNQDHESLGGLLGGAPNDHQHLTTTQVGYLPTADQKDALAGTGTPSASNVFVTADDSRLTDARTPVAHTQAWSTITSTPTTIAGYGITDAVLISDPRLSDARVPVAHTQDFSTITNTPTTVAGYGITDAVLLSDPRLTDSRNPNGSASGDLSGNYPAPTVAAIQGTSVSSTAPVAGQALVFNGTVWAPTGSATSGLSTQKFTGSFTAASWVDNGDGTASISFAHGLTMSGGSLAIPAVYELVGGANKLVGGIDFECGPVNAIMTIDSSAKFDGSLHLVYAG